jgi:excisionase family DNA binding protein
MFYPILSSSRFEKIRHKRSGGMFMEIECLWTVKEVAAAVQVSVQTVYRYVMKKDIPFIKIGGAVRFDRAAIRSWLESRKACAAVNENKLAVKAACAHGEADGTENGGGAGV